jgi:dTDP-glucose 4,6-dehydratase
LNDPQQRRPDISRAREVLGWEPTIELEEGLVRLLEQSSREALIGRVVGA